MPTTETIALTPQQMALIQNMADDQGITVDELASQLLQAAIAEAVQHFTGHRRARLYGQAANVLAPAKAH